MTGPDPAVGARTGTVSAVLCIAQRDVTKLLRDRTRLAVTLAFPFLLILGLGSVLRPTVGRVTGLDAVSLAFTGVLAATLFQSTAAGMISIAEDRETDFARELFVAPVPRSTLIGGKILGESLVALCKGACVTLFALLLGVPLTPARLPGLIAVGAACCLLGGAFGLATVAAVPRQRAAMDVFQFLIIPQYVLAGVLVPVHALPGYLDVVAWAMPLRYAVGLTRATFYAGTAGYRQVLAGGPVLDTVVMAGTTAVLLVAGGALFDRRERSR